MNKLPEVKNEVEVQVLSHPFTFHRLRWTDMDQVNSLMSPLIPESLAQLAVALKYISGRSMKPDESLQVLTKLPKSMQQSVYKLFMGSLDPHRFFSCQSLSAAPDAAAYAKRIAEEEEETEKVNDEVEEFLINKFGRKEVEEEMELSRQIVEGTGYAGAIRLENEELNKASYEEQYLADARRHVTDE